MSGVFVSFSIMYNTAVVAGKALYVPFHVAHSLAIHKETSFTELQDVMQSQSLPLDRISCDKR